ncbi:uroporphyrinogen decarboxylase [Bergeyella cardium]|uniref:Uroporphyrinogen decarboxylase n=1 Tax=Bergeyella cardium TaxID=1585976 RepID=A0A6P1QVW3_9FLAO|nr:uroporphyrinogen decarboxylase [Bergeyella cardium]QHN65163.1 uroporphyrinogen decarboxylase [Bergeyella cardium]WHE34479.1 uroporphyrinogen decarboxylase [Bergeyella cardium]WHF61130.1 uroporphyrinogen decarboxylase [Bergeyella cardium]
MNSQIAEYIGYTASIFIVLSFVFKNITTIRIINMIGCMCFVVYGFYSGDKPFYPVIIPNAILSVVQIFFLIKESKNKPSNS